MQKPNKRDEWFREMDEADARKARAQREARANQARKEAKRKRKQAAGPKPQPAASPNPKAAPNPRSPLLTALGLRDDQDTPQAIRSAYRRLALRFHPDKNPAGAESFKEILAAYEELIEE